MSATVSAQQMGATPVPHYFLCVDGGGSKCTAVLISSSGTTLVGEAGPCNPSTIGLDATVAVISSAVHAALASHEETASQTHIIASLPVASAWVGIAGYDRPSLAPAIDEAIVRLLGIPLGSRLRITADIDLLSVNATGSANSAIVLVAGTGSVAMSYTRNKKDKDDLVLTRSGRIGGWGPLLGDDGSGFAIGREALRIALRTSDALQGGLATEKIEKTEKKAMPALSQAVFDFFRQERQGTTTTTGTEFHPRDLLSCILTSTASSASAASSSPTKTIAHAARLVLSLGDKDGQARRILEQGAASLADLVVELLRVQGMDPAQTALIMAGGLLCNDTYNGMVRNELAKRHVAFRWSTQVHSPALAGARFLATSRTGV